MAKYSKGQKSLANLKKQRAKYPAIVDKLLEKSDIILEILDARFIDDTRNIEIEEEIKKLGKKIIYVFNKADLKDKIEYGELLPSIAVSCKSRRGIGKLRDLIKIEAKKIKKPERVAVGVIGYPNVGKSSLINLLIGKASAGVGSDAGFTKSMQKLKLTSEIVLLDTPGVIPKSEYSSSDPNAFAKHVKVGGRSHSQIKEPGLIVDKLMKDLPNVFEKHYKIKSDGDSEILIEELGKQKGFIKKGGVVDEDKTARLILKDWQTGKIKI